MKETTIRCESDREGNMRVTAYIAVHDLARLQDDPVARLIISRGANTASDWCLLMESVFHAKETVKG